MNKRFFLILMFKFIYAGYSIGDQITSEHQNLSYDVCYGDYQTEQLSLSDFASQDHVIWIIMSASW